MAKKPKEPHTTNSNDRSNSGSGLDSGSSSSSVFKTLFGDIPEQGTSASIFSDNNPFRRKPSDRSQTTHHHHHHHHHHQQELGLGFGGPGEDVGSTKNGDFESPDSVELKKKKRKRNKDKKGNAGLDSVGEETSEAPLEIKKVERDEIENPKGIDSENGNRGKYHNLGSDLKALSAKKEKKGNLSSKMKGISINDDAENPSLGIGSKGMSEEERENAELNRMVRLESERKGEDGEKKKKKNKRKREEIEAEYEARRYGLVVAENDSGKGGLGRVVVGEKRKTLDNPEDMMVSKEGFDDESKLLRTVFVGNLPLKVKKKALLREFGQFGEVESVRIRSIPIVNSKVPRKGAVIKKQINDSAESVNAYIVFNNEESAQASLSHNMAMIGGNHIRVDRACPPRKKLKGESAPLYDTKRTIFVGNLPFDVKDEEIYQLFCGIKNLESSIEAVRVVRDPGSSVGKGIAYVLFKTRDAANLVVKKRNLKLQDRELRLYHAKSNATPSKRKNSSSTEINNSPAKKFVVDSRTPDRNNKVKTKAAIYYQGLRASKSGVQKKVHRKTKEPVNLKSRTEKVQKPKERKTKRPAVAARKANIPKGGGATKQAGKKRMLDSQTPESARRNKKFRRFK